MTLNLQTRERLGAHLDRVAIIVSTGRTGTLALSQFFALNFRDVTAVHEPSPSQRFRFISNLHHCGHLSSGTIGRLLLQARRQRLNRIRSGAYIESNPFLHGCLDIFDQVFDNVRVVHVVRHPVDFIRSAIKHGSFSDIKGLGRRFCPYWTLKPEHYEPESGRKWRLMAPEERLAWRWSRINGELERGAELFGERYIRLRFEDLFDAQSSGLVELTNWLDLDLHRLSTGWPAVEQLNQGQRTKARSYHDWPTDIAASVRDLCAEQMGRYGYTSLDPEHGWFY